MNDIVANVRESLVPVFKIERTRRAAVEPISQIHLSLENTGELDVFEKARHVILEFAKRRAGGTLPQIAMDGESFSIDEIGSRRLEGVALASPQRYWTLRFDDDDREVAGRSWVIETTLGEQSGTAPVLFGVRLQCIARGENPTYDRSIPSFVRDVISTCDSRLDRRVMTTSAWVVETKADVSQLVGLLLSGSRAADVIVISLPENSNDRAEELVSSDRLARDLSGAAHVVVISGQAAFFLSDRLGREFSVFQQAVRTYRPGFDPDIDDPLVHPLAVATRVANWNGGPNAFRRFITSEVLRRTVEGADAFEKLPSFAEAKRTEAEVRRRDAQQSGSSNDELLALAEGEIDQLKIDLAALKQENGELLEVAESERDAAEAEAHRLQSTYFHLQQRLQSLKSSHGMEGEPEMPDDLTELQGWSEKYLAGVVELHNRALRGAKSSEYEDPSFIYQALLLLRDYYVPMRRDGAPTLKQAFDQRCQELGIEEQASFSGNRAAEQGDTYFVRLGHRRIELDRHLKKGNSREPRYCFRLYFFWDDVMSQVVVGWLPSHLSTRAS